MSSFAVHKEQQSGIALDPASPGLAVVTGGADGIGREVVLQLAQRGWDIAFCDLNENEQASSLCELIENSGRCVFFQACDVGDKTQVEKFFIAVEEFYGTAPALVVNNAGVQTWSTLLELQEQDWDRVIDTNLKGSFLTTQIASKLMIKHDIQGSIINIGSGCNSRAFPRLVDYTASKGGVEMFTKVSALELGEYSIRVNCVAPGGVIIERTRKECDNYGEVWSEVSALNRVGTPLDIANAVAFLASEEASFITGQTLHVDGGVSAKSNWPY
ncbi:MAG: SDR family oxidoreductase [Pseudomonadota bacterium]